jgi:hypothetical protein
MASTVIKITVTRLDAPLKRPCSRHRSTAAVAVVETKYKAPFGGQPINQTTHACGPCATRAETRTARGRWVREPLDDGTRFGTWYYLLDDQRWELQRRTGEDDFGWYLYGPDGAPFGQHLARQLGPAKLLAQDYADDYPGARDWVRGAYYADDYETYRDRAAQHERRK